VAHFPKALFPERPKSNAKRESTARLEGTGPTIAW